MPLLISYNPLCPWPDNEPGHLSHSLKAGKYLRAYLTNLECIKRAFEKFHCFGTLRILQSFTSLQTIGGLWGVEELSSMKEILCAACVVISIKRVACTTTAGFTILSYLWRKLLSFSCPIHFPSPGCSKVRKEVYGRGGRAKPIALLLLARNSRKKLRKCRLSVPPRTESLPSDACITSIAARGPGSRYCIVSKRICSRLRSFGLRLDVYERSRPQTSPSLPAIFALRHYDIKQITSAREIDLHLHTIPAR